MIDSEARKQLAELLMNLAESLLEDDDVGIITQDGKKKELRVNAILDDSTTLIAVKFWTAEEIDELKREAIEEWPEVIQ